MADIIRKKRDPETLAPATNLTNFPTISTQWIQRFLRRHLELSAIRARNMDASRIKDTSPEQLSKWFADLEKVTEEHDVSPENMYNMDESGFSIGEVEALKCIINADIRQKFQKAKPRRQEWVTLVECICSDGTAILPLIIFKGESLLRTWILANTDKSWCFSHNSKGWTSNLHGLEWLQRCFDPTTWEKANGGRFPRSCGFVVLLSCLGFRVFENMSKVFSCGCRFFRGLLSLRFCLHQARHILCFSTHQ
jgi:DDE superfamily endonuclease